MSSFVQSISLDFLRLSDVHAIEQLLERSADTLQTFYVRRGDVNKSQLNFRRFLNVTKFGFENFPLRPHYIATHQKQQAKRKAEKVAHDAAVANAIQELELIFNE